MKTCLWTDNYGCSTQCGESYSFGDDDYNLFRFCPFCGDEIAYKKSQERIENEKRISEMQKSDVDIIFEKASKRISEIMYQKIVSRISFLPIVKIEPWPKIRLP